jgi:hypothetical protein
MVAAYRKKPVVIQALQWKGDNEVEVLQFCSKCFIVTGDSLKINTLEGTMSASVGDYIIKGVEGEFYACKPDIFKKTYESVAVNQD